MVVNIIVQNSIDWTVEYQHYFVFVMFSSEKAMHLTAAT